jgi:hypothetical protein
MIFENVILKKKIIAAFVIAGFIGIFGYAAVDGMLFAQKAKLACQNSGFQGSYATFQMRGKIYAVCGSYPNERALELTNGILKEIK